MNFKIKVNKKWINSIKLWKKCVLTLNGISGKKIIGKCIILFCDNMSFLMNFWIKAATS